MSTITENTFETALDQQNNVRIEIYKPLYHHPRLIIFVFVLQWCDSSVLPKYFTKCFFVRITHFVHYFINGFPIDLQSLFCRFDFHPLHVFQGSVSGSFYKLSVKLPSAKSEFGG